MAGKAKTHLVDGRWTTVSEIAAELGLTRQQIYAQMHNKHCSLQVVANLCRENQILNGQNNAQRWMVDGQWLTVTQAAEMLGVKPQNLRNWRDRNRHPDGSSATLQEAVEFYRAGLNTRRGHAPVQHRVGRKLMTTADAAKLLGTSVFNVRTYMSRNHATLAQTIRHYQQRQQRKAEKDIMSILMEGKT